MSGSHESKWKIFISRLRKYLHYYGGWSEIFSSPFFNLAFVLSLLNYQMWQDSWVQLSQSLIPSMLGFSLGTYAILFSIISVKLKRALREVENERGVPYLHEMNATFFHFIFVQVLCVTLSFFHTGTSVDSVLKLIWGPTEFASDMFWWGRAFSGLIGTTLIFYSLFLAVAAAMIVYRLATIIEPESKY
jgi:hypothetical protein